MAQAPAASEQITALRTTYQEELERNRREIDEFERLIRQTQGEADKLAQRELSATSQLRNLQANLDRFSKEDIRSIFTMVQEVQMRLLSVRNQVEQLQMKVNRTRERQAELGRLLDLLGQLDSTNGGVQASAGQPQESEHQNLIGEVIQAQEKERLRISLQMHDGPAQTLSNLILRADICERLIDRDVNQARSELSGLKKAINATLQETRRFIFDLRPMILDDLGLVPTLRRYAQDFGERFNLDVAVAVQNMDNRLPGPYEVAIFRFIQEALSNIQKHAAASHARVVLDALNNQVQVLVEDDGAGFNVTEAMAEKRGNRNMGIAMMRQQIETLLQGQLGIESQPGRGTRIVATVPLRDVAGS